MCLKKFPDYFEKYHIPPEGAREQEIEVFRACITHKCDKESFTPTFEKQNFVHLKDQDPFDPGIYSLSVYSKAKDLKRFLKTNSRYLKPHKLAKGITYPKYGVCQRTSERTKRKNSHIDWWLYEGAEPYKDFEIMDDSEIVKGSGL